MLNVVRDPSRVFADFAVTSASYIVFKGDDGKVYVKNGKTGAIEYSSADHVAAIQYAIDQASAAGGGEVFIRVGFYSLSKSLNPKSNVRIVGEGMGETVLYSPNAPAIWADGVSNVGIEELTVDRGATSGAPDSAPYMGMVFFSCSGVFVRRVEVRNTPNYAVMFGGAKTGDVNSPPYYPCDHVYFVENYIHDSYKDGVHFFGGSRIVVAYNDFERTIDDATAFGASQGYPIEDVLVVGNRVTGWVDPNGDQHPPSAVNLHCDTPNQVPASDIFKRITIAENVFRDTSRESISFRGKSDSPSDMYRDIVIEGNVIERNKLGSLIALDSVIVNATVNLVIRGNIIRSKVEGNIILIASANGFIVEGNTIIKALAYGIYVNGGSNGRIAGNVIIETNSRSESASGVRVVSSSSDMVIEGNVIYALGNDMPIRIGDTSSSSYPKRIAVIGNYVYGGIYGIAVGWNDSEYADTVIINGNTVLGSSSRGSYIGATATNVVVINNRVDKPVRIRGTPIVKRNIGYVTENSGVATIPSGSTSVTVSHGLASAPSKVLVTPLGQPPGKIWVQNITNTSFDIITDTAPTADLRVAWYAEI